MAKRRAPATEVRESPVTAQVDNVPPEHQESYKWLQKRVRTLTTTIRGSLRVIGDDWQGDRFGGDLADGAQITTAFDEEGATITHAEGQLEQAAAAIEAIRGGTHGKCAECGVAIPKVRLNALPFTTHCIKCQREKEKDQ